MSNTSFIQAGKKKREELRLPILHFVVADDWIPKLGPKAFSGWLKFNTLVDRSDKDRDNDIIPRSLEDVAKIMECSVSTLYRTYIQPLWEYGFIDLVEYEDSKRKSQKPKNIIVYEYPQNDKSLESKPLEKVRDWKNYGSDSQKFGRLKGKNKASKPIESYPSKNERVDPSKNERVTLSKIEGINYTNNLINLTNSSSNVSNLNLNPVTILDSLDLPKVIKDKIKIKIHSDKIELNGNQLNEIEEAYYHQIQKGLVIPDVSSDMDGLNDYEFANTIISLLNKVNVKEIRSMKGIIDDWIEKAFNYKFDKLRRIF